MNVGLIAITSAFWVFMVVISSLPDIKAPEEVKEFGSEIRGKIMVIFIIVILCLLFIKAIL